MNKWLSYTAEEVLRGTNSKGSRLIISFSKDYKLIFNQSICPSCKDFKIKYQKFIKKINDMKNKKESGYVLKKMYENIPLKFGSPVYVNNGNMTDEYGEILLKGHPRGEGLFISIPEETEEVKDAITILSEKYNKKELVEKAKSLNLDTSGNKKELAEAIIAEEAKAQEAKAQEAKAEEAKAQEAKAEEAKAEEAKAEEAKAEEAKGEDEYAPDTK